MEDARDLRVSEVDLHPNGGDGGDSSAGVQPPAGVSAPVSSGATSLGTGEMPPVLLEGPEVAADEERRKREEEEREKGEEREKEEAATAKGSGGDGGGEGGAERSGREERREERVEGREERVEERVEGSFRTPEVAAAGSSCGGETSGRDGERNDASGRVVVPPQAHGARGAGRRRGNEPKDKGIASGEERPREQRRVGISREDYAVHADPEIVAQLAQENPLLREVVREEIIQRGRERWCRRGAYRRRRRP